MDWMIVLSSVLLSTVPASTIDTRNDPLTAILWPPCNSISLTWIHLKLNSQTKFLMSVCGALFFRMIQCICYCPSLNHFHMSGVRLWVPDKINNVRSIICELKMDLKRRSESDGLDDRALFRAAQYWACNLHRYEECATSDFMTTMQ